jgi:predicted metal-dependent peptidase
MTETDVKPKEEQNFEYYYEVLKKFKKRNSKNGSGGKTNGCNKGMGSDISNIASPENSSGDYPHDWESQDSERTSNTAKQILQEALNSMDSKKRGNVPSSILSQIEKMLAKPEISWKDVLKRFIGTIPYPYKSTRTRLNRREPNRIDLPGRVPKKKCQIVICIDTSGSMSDDAISYCMNEVFHIAKENETEITVIECDSQVNRVYVAKKPSEIKPEVCGRGGTSFTPAIEYINSEKKFKRAVMIYFTDGYGEQEIPKPLTHRNIWVVLEDAKCLSVKNPYGEVKSLKMDGDFKKYMKNKRGW